MERIARALWWSSLATGLLIVLAACSQESIAPSANEMPLIPTAASTAGPTGEPGSALTLLPKDVAEEIRTAGIRTSAWRTDFTRRSVPLTEFMSGGPPKDGIPSVDDPKFIPVNQADTWLAGVEPVQLVEINGDARAYPLQILIWHEIVNDEIGGMPVAVTYCPLCNTALAFDATLPDGRVLDFGVSGMLRFSDLVMYDRQTESWWQQATGEALVGELTGTRLEFLPAPIISWEDFKRAHPSGLVLSRDTGVRRDYGRNPYVGYDSGRPFLFSGPEDGRLPAVERVVAVEIGDETMAFPFSVLERHPVVHGSVGGQDIVVFYKQGTASALDSGAISQGRDVGATGVFSRVLAGQELTFRLDGEHFRDQQTGTAWDLLGHAVEGPLEGARLEPVVHGNHFWFVWAVFKPDTQVYQGE